MVPASSREASSGDASGRLLFGGFGESSLHERGGMQSSAWSFAETHRLPSVHVVRSSHGTSRHSAKNAIPAARARPPRRTRAPDAERCNPSARRGAFARIDVDAHDDSERDASILARLGDDDECSDFETVAPCSQRRVSMRGAARSTVPGGPAATFVPRTRSHGTLVSRSSVIFVASRQLDATTMLGRASTRTSERLGAARPLRPRLPPSARGAHSRRRFGKGKRMVAPTLTPTEKALLREVRLSDEDHGGLTGSELAVDEYDAMARLCLLGLVEAVGEYGEAPDGEEDEREAGASAVVYRITAGGVEALADDLVPRPDDQRSPVASRRSCRSSRSVEPLAPRVAGGAFGSYVRRRRPRPGGPGGSRRWSAVRRVDETRGSQSCDRRRPSSTACTRLDVDEDPELRALPSTSHGARSAASVVSVARR